MAAADRVDLRALDGTQSPRRLANEAAVTVGVEGAGGNPAGVCIEHFAIAGHDDRAHAETVGEQALEIGTGGRGGGPGDLDIRSFAALEQAQ